VSELTVIWKSDSTDERRLFPYSPGEARLAVPLPDWAYVHAERRRKGVTLSLLWEEYRGVHPDGYGYSRYCELYTRWERSFTPRPRHSVRAAARFSLKFDRL
jgi:transposase